MRRRFRNSLGFTLLELLAVLFLIALVAGVALMAYEGVRDDAAYTTTRAEMAELRKALRQFRLDVGHFPATLDLLGACTVSEDAACTAWNPDLKRGWHGPYLSTGANADAWGNPYLLLDPSDTTPNDNSDGVARLVSLGPDGVDGAGGTVNSAHDSCTPITGSDDLVTCLLK